MFCVYYIEDKSEGKEVRLLCLSVYTMKVVFAHVVQIKVVCPLCQSVLMGKEWPVCPNKGGVASVLISPNEGGNASLGHHK